MISTAHLMSHRQGFVGLANSDDDRGSKAYFNYGGQGLLADVTLTTIVQHYQHLQTLGPFSLATGSQINTITENLRQTLAQALGTTPHTIALTENVSASCNLGLLGYPWQTGDALLLSDCEHGSIRATAQALVERFGIQLHTCTLVDVHTPDLALARIRSSLTPQTRLVCLSHVLWNTGLVLPLAQLVQICRDYDSSQSRQKSGGQNDRPLTLVIDAAQSVGMLPLHLDTLGVDVYGFTGHKWFCGPEGVGGAYIRPEALGWLQPLAQGWRGIDESPGQSFTPKAGARRFEIATSAYPLYGGLTTAIQHQNQLASPEERYDRILHLADRLWHTLHAIPQITCLQPQPPQSGLIAFQIAQGQSSDVVQQLESKGFYLRTLTYPPGTIRACVHYLTLESEIDRLGDHLRQIL